MLRDLLTQPHPAQTAPVLVHQLHGWPEPVEFTPLTHELSLTFATEIGHFLNVVQRGEPSQATFDHAARVLQLTLGAYGAAEGHCVISLPEDPTQAGVPVTTAATVNA